MTANENKNNRPTEGLKCPIFYLNQNESIQNSQNEI